MIDKEPSSPKVVREYFKDVGRTIKLLHPDVIHLAWPSNYDTGMIHLLGTVPVVIYVGKNTDGSACGTPNLFACLRWREVLAYVPRQQNTLIVYGAIRKEPRKALYHEEMAGLDRDKVWEYSSTMDLYTGSRRSVAI